MQKPYLEASAPNGPSTSDCQFNIYKDEFRGLIYSRDTWSGTNSCLRDAAGLEAEAVCSDTKPEFSATASEIMPSDERTNDAGHWQQRRSADPKRTLILCGESPVTEAELCEYLAIHPAFTLLSSIYDRGLAGALVADARPDLLVVVASRLSPEDVTFVQSCRQSCPDSAICVLFEAAEPVIERQVLATGALVQRLELTDIDAVAHVLGAARVGRSGTIDRPQEETSSETIELSDRDRTIGRLLGLGMSVRAIAATLELDVARVLRHREVLRTALCCATVAELTALLARYLV